MSTKIEWADMTVNPVVGCSHCSPGCAHCYAERFAARMVKHPNPKISGKYAGVVDKNGKWTGKVSGFDRSLFYNLPTKPKRIFVGSMTDLFHEGTSFEDLRYAWKQMAFLSQHTFMILTKRAKRMSDFFKDDKFVPPKNIWLGVTVCNQEEADAKIPLLLQTPAAVRFVSIEPMLGPIDLVGWGNIRQGENLSPEHWPDFAWPEWVPAKVRQKIESFWSWETYKRTPRQWLDNAVQNCGGIALGSLVGVDNVTWKGSKTVRPYNDYRSYRTGRFVHAWSNMCLVVYDDGTFDYASYNGRFYLSSYPVLGTDKYQPLINWVICGGETGPGARPMHPDWVRSLRDQCQSEGVPYFFKGWGEWVTENQSPEDIVLPSHSKIPRGWKGRKYEDSVDRVGKRRAGRLLDGREWNEVPEVSC